MIGNDPLLKGEPCGARPIISKFVCKSQDCCQVLSSNPMTQNVCKFGQLTNSVFVAIDIPAVSFSSPLGLLEAVSRPAAR